MFEVLYFALPGSTRSGEKHKKKSLPTFKPPCSSIGSTTSVGGTGVVVDSRMTSIPGWKNLAISPHADTM